MSALTEHRSEPGDPSDDPDVTRWDRSGAPVGADPDATVVAQDTAYVTPARVEFGRHFEANYARLVAQMYAMTLDAGEAHEVVQEAYARAWRKWPKIVETEDPLAWVRRVAVSTVTRGWRSMLGRVGLRRPRPAEASDMEPQSAALIGALHRVSPAERRAVVLHHMVGLSTADIAAIERTSASRIESRLYTARLALTRALATISWRYDEQDHRGGDHLE